MNNCFPSKSNDPKVATIYIHEVSITPTLYSFNISLQQNAIINTNMTRKSYVYWTVHHSDS